MTDDETIHPDATRAGINLDDRSLLYAFSSAATMVDVWKRGGYKPDVVAQHSILDWQNGDHGDHLALIAAALKTGFGQ